MLNKPHHRYNALTSEWVLGMLQRDITPKTAAERLKAISSTHYKALLQK